MRPSRQRRATTALSALALLPHGAHAILVANETATALHLANDRLAVAFNRSSGAVSSLRLDGQDLLGAAASTPVTPGGATGNGDSGIGPYLDCYCTPEGAWTPGADGGAEWALHRGADGRGVPWGGVVMRAAYAPTGVALEQYWFLREGETGLHTFSRVSYLPGGNGSSSSTDPTNTTTTSSSSSSSSSSSLPSSAGVLQELRTLFRPTLDSSIWTHLVVDEALWAPLPVPDPAGGDTSGGAVTVQDATWDLGSRGDADPYVQAFSRYYTKYTFSAEYGDQKVHGMYANGSRGTGGGNESSGADGGGGGGEQFGAWLVMNTKDTYFGGPTWSDLTVDGIVYNYIVSNHHGNQAPNMTSGFDRTFGPSYYYFNHRGPGLLPAAGANSSSSSRNTTTASSNSTAPQEDGWRELHADALRLADPGWNAPFYDDIAHLVPNYAPTSARGRLRAVVEVPPPPSPRPTGDADTDAAAARRGGRPVAVLSAEGWDVQDNSQDVSAYQYWVDVDAETGAVAIDRVRAGTYRLTVYCAGVFGEYVRDGVVVEAGRETDLGRVVWVAEEAGTELWRIGTPDKAGGEWLHGDHPDPAHPLHPAEYRIYWAAYDYLDDFPEGVRFTVGASDEARDLNYIHWSVFGGYANALRPGQVEDADGRINNWTVAFGLAAEQLGGASVATLTIQLAGAKGASGNTDVRNATQVWSDLPYTVVVNGRELETWIIPYYQSSSCGVRSAVSGCYHLSHNWEFPASYLTSGEGAADNEIVLSLPYNATDYESAVLPRSVYVQYDALRLEVK